MARTKRRSICPVACALDLFGDRWTLLLIRDMACGKSLFKEFSASPERIATNILADRLERLVVGGLAESNLVHITQSHGRVGKRLKP
jgi:DNA-binding HxlR family transcriptional regulator